MHRLKILILTLIVSALLCACSDDEGSITESSATTAQSGVQITTQPPETENVITSDEYGIYVNNNKYQYLCLDSRMYYREFNCALAEISADKTPVTYGYFDGDEYVYSEEVFTGWNEYLGDAELVDLSGFPHENMQVSVEDKIQRVALYKYEDKGYLGVAYYYNSLGMEYHECYLWLCVNSQSREDWLEIFRAKMPTGEIVFG